MKNVYEKAKQVLEDAYNRGDADAVAVIEGGYGSALCELFEGCYSWEDFGAWLLDHDFDICQDFRFSNRYTYEEIIEEVDNGNENPEGTYNLDVEGWAELDNEEKIERIKDAADCLLIGDCGLCVSW